MSASPFAQLQAQVRELADRCARLERLLADRPAADPDGQLSQKEFARAVGLSPRRVQMRAHVNPLFQPVGQSAGRPRYAAFQVELIRAVQAGNLSAEDAAAELVLERNLVGMRTVRELRRERREAAPRPHRRGAA